MVCVFDNVEDPNEEPSNDKAKGTKMHIKLSFNNSRAGEDLKNDLAEIEQEQDNKTSARRHGASVGGYREMGRQDASSTYFAQRKDRGSLARGSSEMTYRPYSAKTDFNGTYSRNPYSKREGGHQMHSSQHFMNHTPSMRTLKQRRPQTAASIGGMMRKSNSKGRFQTMEPKMGMQSSIAYSQKMSQSRKKLKTKIKDLEFHAEVDGRGEVSFTDIPKSVYTVTVDQSDFFKSTEKEFNLCLEEAGYGKVEVYLPLEKQHAYTTTIYMTREEGVTDHEQDVDPAEQEESKDYDQINRNYHTDLELRAILLELYDTKPKNDDGIIDDDSSDEEIDYEEDFETFEDKHGITCYKCRLMPGKYMVVAKGKDIKEYSQIISISDQITILAFTPDRPMSKSLICQTYDGKTGEKLNNVLIKLRKAHSKITTQGLTGSGMIAFQTNQN